MGVAAPSAQEAAHGAGRTELHRCALCASTTRFPRYNDVQKLLETR
jgi:peptide-N4-(N-acetyl-beta-glucosaminyl)asparagine amidase